MLGKFGPTRSERNTLEIEDMQEPIELHDREHRVPERKIYERRATHREHNGQPVCIHDAVPREPHQNYIRMLS